MQRKKGLVTPDDENLIDYRRDPVFQFATEVDAHLMLDALRDELEAARAHEREVMRYMRAAVIAAADVVEGGRRVSRTPIIDRSGLSRRTVYQILDEV